MFAPFKPNTISPSTSHSGSRNDESISRQKSSNPSGIELQDFDSSHQVNQSTPRPLLDQSNRSGADFVKKTFNGTRPLQICICLTVIVLLVILLSIPNNKMVGYRISSSYIRADGSLYSIALKSINQLISVE